MMPVDELLEMTVEGRRLSDQEFIYLWDEADFLDLGQAACAVRDKRFPDRVVAFIIDRNINYYMFLSVPVLRLLSRRGHRRRLCDYRGDHVCQDRGCGREECHPADDPARKCLSINSAHVVICGKKPCSKVYTKYIDRLPNRDGWQEGV